MVLLILFPFSSTPVSLFYSFYYYLILSSPFLAIVFPSFLFTFLPSFCLPYHLSFFSFLPSLLSFLLPCLFIYPLISLPLFFFPFFSVPFILPFIFSVHPSFLLPYLSIYPLIPVPPVLFSFFLFLLFFHSYFPSIVPAFFYSFLLHSPFSLPAFYLFTFCCT